MYAQTKPFSNNWDWFIQNINLKNCPHFCNGWCGNCVFLSDLMLLILGEIHKTFKYIQHDGR